MVSPNWRIKPDWVWMDGKEVRCPRGTCYIDFTDPSGKRVRTQHSGYILSSPEKQNGNRGSVKGHNVPRQAAPDSKEYLGQPKEL